MKSGLLRIASNYTRLLLTLALGLAVVRIQIVWLGDEAFGIVSLLAASVGVAGLFRDLTHRSMIRELGAAYHSDDPERFLSTYNSAFVVSAAVTAVTAGSFVVLLALFPYLDISPAMRGPARALLLWQATHAVLIVLLSPAFNMYMVQHRFVGYNAWYVLIRAANLMAAVLLAEVMGVPGDPPPLAFYGFVWATLDNLFLLVAVGLLMARDRRLLIRPRYMSRAGLRSIVGTFGWNTGVQLAMAAIERAPPFILNVMVGPIANTVWGVVYRLVSYVRMATIGVQFGADSVSAKLSAGEDEHGAARVRDFMSNQTRLNALVALPTGLVMFALADPLLAVWVGHKLRNPELVLGPAATMTRVLAIAVVTRAVSEGWMTVLYGAGYVARYAWVIFAGGVLAPVLGVALVWALPAEHKMQGPALALMLVMSTVYLLALPVVGARCVQQPYWRMLSPMLRPLAVGAVAAPCLWIGRWLPQGVVGQLVAPGAVFGAVYGLLGAVLVLNPRERRRLLAVLDRLRHGGQSPRTLSGED